MMTEREWSKKLVIFFLQCLIMDSYNNHIISGGVKILDT